MKLTKQVLLGTHGVGTNHLGDSSPWAPRCPEANRLRVPDIRKGLRSLIGSTRRGGMSPPGGGFEVTRGFTTHMAIGVILVVLLSDRASIHVVPDAALRWGTTSRRRLVSKSTSWVQKML